MNQILLNILTTAATCIVLPLISLLVIKLPQWLNTKIKMRRLKSYLLRQPKLLLTRYELRFVESLNASGGFGKGEQLIVLDKAKAVILSEMTTELKDWVTTKYGDLQSWVSNQNEASIYKLKN